MEYIRKDKTKKDEIINDHITLKHYEVYNDGACQCFKDCDCAKNKGVKSKFAQYKHPLSKLTFPSIEKCENDYILALNNKKKIEAQMVEAKEWFNSLSVKKQNSMIDIYKQHSKNYKKHNHKVIKQNGDILTQIHRSLIKWGLL